MSKKKDRNEVSLEDRMEAQRKARDELLRASAWLSLPNIATSYGGTFGTSAVANEPEFSDRPFTVGSLTGRRAFRVDKYGRLVASQLNYVWLPGENRARCLKEHVLTFTFSYSGLGYEPSRADTPHDVASLKCTCGFYGYFDNQANPYHKDGTIQGLIEGWGTVTIGSRGFRSSKARISALVIPPAHSLNVAQVRHNYPDIPVFETEVDALAEFPLTPPAPTHTPETDPEFWTRDAL